MTKSMRTAILVLIVLFAGCGAFIRTLQREEAAQDVGHFLIRHRLRNNISFSATSGEPLVELYYRNYYVGV